MGLSGNKRRSAALPAGVLAGVVVAMAPIVAVTGAPGPSTSGARSTYVVQLTLPPLATYGGVGVTAASSERHAARIDRGQGQVLAAARLTGTDVLYRYRNAFSGFAARLTGPEATALAAQRGVLAVTKDERHQLLKEKEKEKEKETAPPRSGPLGADGAAFLGLPEGLWKTLGGPERAGEGVIVGVIDSGISPDHPSFAADPAGPDGRRLYQGPAYSAPPKVWRGSCQAGEEWTVTTCNNKLIGARYFVEGFGADKLAPEEFVSARDADGHGSHTAATAAGNYGVDPVFAGTYDLGLPLVSGMAPRAYVAAYKACWIGPDAGERAAVAPNSCTTSDLLAAIDAAVSDGVDVINYSIGSATSEVLGPTAQAFLAAADAGIFVSTAAGNSGPDPGSVGSPASVPWVTSVGASTLARSFRASVVAHPEGGSGESGLTARGKSLSGPLGRTPLVDSAAVAAPGVKPEDAELCFPGSLDPTRVEGQVVLCRRGTNPRVEKGTVVRDAGARGMVLYNATPAETLVADPHVLPAVHISNGDGEELRRMLRTGTPVDVELTGGRAVADVGDRLAPFSSRGPQTAVPDIPKPDLVAPGVDILAAGTPAPVGPAPKGENFAVLSGTSMAAPHVAGVAALLTQKDPARSPAALRSALMTTAQPVVVKEDGRTPASALDAGAGRIDPNRAADPGLVLEVDTGDYLRYLEGRDPRIVDGDLPPLAPVDLNLPAVSFGALAGKGATARTFTSTGPERTSWTVAVEGLTGLGAQGGPTSFDIAPGQAQAVNLAFEVDDEAAAPADVYTFGALVLTEAGPEGLGRTVRLPLSVRPVKLAAPVAVEVVTDQASGARNVPVTAGYQGELSALGWGLAGAVAAPGQTIASGVGANRFEPSPGVDVFDVNVAPGTQVLAGRIGNADGGAPPGPDGKPSVDLDFFLLFDDEGDGFDAGDDVPVGESADGDADEAIALVRPRPGAYRFSVVGFKVADPQSTYDFASWTASDPGPDDPALPADAPGLALRGDPVAVTRGSAAALSLEWAGLGDDGTYFGLITWHEGATPDPARPAAVTVVRIVKAPAGATPPPWPDGRNTPPL